MLLVAYWRQIRIALDPLLLLFKGIISRSDFPRCVCVTIANTMATT